MGAARRFDWDEAARLRAEGMTYHAIATRAGVTDAAVWLSLNPSARRRNRERHAEWQRGGACEECGGACIRPTHPSRTEHAAKDGRMLCTRCRGRASRQGVTLVNGEIVVTCFSCKEEKPLSEYAPRVGRAIVAGNTAKRRCRACETAKRQEYRERHKVPCARCGSPRLPASEIRGRRGPDSGLCAPCWQAEHLEEARQKATKLRWVAA